jgi:hypothetical protein
MVAMSCLALACRQLGEVERARELIDRANRRGASWNRARSDVFSERSTRLAHCIAGIVGSRQPFEICRQTLDLQFGHRAM